MAVTSHAITQFIQRLFELPSIASKRDNKKPESRQEQAQRPLEAVLKQPFGWKHERQRATPNRRKAKRQLERRRASML